LEKSLRRKVGRVSRLAFRKGLALFMCFVSLTMICGCQGSKGPPQVSFLVDWVTTPPTRWNIDTTSINPLSGAGPVLRVEVRPVVPNAYLGISDSVELFLNVKSGGIIREGNHVRGPSNFMAGAKIALDVGGNLWSSTASAEIWVKAYLFKNGVLDSVKETPHKTLTFVPVATPSKTVNVEYDHQVPHGIFGDSGAPAGRFRIDEAFGAANTKLNIIVNESTLTDEEFVVADSELALKTRCAQYVLINHQLRSTHLMYLVGAKKVTWNLPIKIYGYSIYDFQNPADTNQTRYRSSFLFMQEIRGQNVNLDQFASKVLIHEFGLQRAKLSLASPPNAFPTPHPEQHDLYCPT